MYPRGGVLPLCQECFMNVNIREVNICDVHAYDKVVHFNNGIVIFYRL